MREVVGAEHHVDVPGTLDDPLPVLLGEASAHRDLQVGPLRLQRLQPPEVAVELVIGVLTDAARVEDDHVGGLDVVGRDHALGREQARDPLRVVLVHLAPERAHVEPARHICAGVGRLGHGREVYGSISHPRLVAGSLVSAASRYQLPVTR